MSPAPAQSATVPDPVSAASWTTSRDRPALAASAAPSSASRSSSSKKHPLYPLLATAYGKTIVFSNEGHGSLCLAMLASGIGARQLSDQAWKAFQGKFFPQVLAAAKPNGYFSHIAGKGIAAQGSTDNLTGPIYNTAIYTLLLQLDAGRLRFIGQRHL